MCAAGQALSDLAEHGFHVIDAARSSEDAAAVHAALGPLLAETGFGSNNFVGTKTKRIHSVFGRTRALDALAVDPVVLEVVAGRLGGALLSASVACEIHPGETAQAVHTDDGIYPLPQDHADVALSALWAIDDFTSDNGATVVFPQSQGQRATPPDPGTGVRVEMAAGSVLLYSGTLWHGGGANTSDATRLGIIFTYAESWLRAQDSHLISVPVEMARGLTPELRALLGYAMRPPFLGYVDGRDPRELFEPRVDGLDSSEASSGDV
jgi:ectoine hydroxylase-related dioxygenase (phytanoyl-CoA dioxygenase family)